MIRLPLNGRAVLCAKCPTPCDKQGSTYFHAHPRSKCPLPEPRWGPMQLGTAVERVAKPVARTIDAALGTNLVNCRGCAERRDRLNRLTTDPVDGP